MDMNKVMCYEAFKSTVLTLLPGYLKDSTKVFTVENIYKNNIVEDALVETESGRGTKVVPSINLTQAYENYRHGRTIESVLQEMAETYESALMESPEIDKDLLKLDDVKDLIIFRLIGRQSNLKMLEKVPYRSFLDMAVIYCVRFDENHSVLIGHELAYALGLSEEDLWALAYENTRRVTEPKVRNFEAMKSSLIILSNKDYYYGAAGMLYTELIEEYAARIPDDVELYLIPCSVHECILLPSPRSEESNLLKMVCDVNAEAVEKKDRLTNSLYRFDRKTKKIVLACRTDTEE